MGEFDLLAKVRERLPPLGPRVLVGSGDDAAVTLPGGATATSIDALVDGVHFRREWATPAQIGRKALATALSDLAAMGAEPGEAYVALGAPADFGEPQCLELIDGILALALESGTTLAGGDITRAPALTLAVTVVGHATAPERLVRRGGAQPGDVLVLTGEIGGAAAGLLLLERPELAAAIDANIVERLRARQIVPLPRLEEGRLLAATGARSMIDLSDGLGADAAHLATASGAGLRIEAATLPLQNGVAAVATTAGLDPLELAASGGEDYELLAALPPQCLDEAMSKVKGTGAATLTRVGEVVADDGVEIRLSGGRLLATVGFDQFRRGPDSRSSTAP